MNIFKRYLVTCFLVALGTLPAQAQAQTAAVTAYAVQDVTSRTGFFDATYTFKRSFAANDPTFPNKTDYVKRNLSIAKSGNPLNWVKNNALTLAVTAAVAAAGYAIDELSNQIKNPGGLTAPESYVEGAYWTLNGTYSKTAQGIVDQAANTLNGYTKMPEPYNMYYNGYYGPLHYTAFVAYVDGNGTVKATTPFHSNACSGSSAWYCQPLTEAEMESGDTPLTDAEAWEFLEPVFAANPALLADSLTDALGNPYYFQEVADAADAIGAGVTGYTDYAGNIVTEPLGDAPDVAADTAPLDFSGLELPTDYSREDTTQGVLDKVTELADFFNTSSVQDYAPQDPNTEYWNTIFDPVESDMQSVADPVGDPTSLMPTLPQYTATCETLSYGMMGATFTFPTASQCEKLNTGKTIIGWFLYVVTAGLIINLFLSRTGRALT